MQITKVEMTSKGGWKITYQEDGAIKTFQSEQIPSEEFKVALNDCKDIFVDHTQMKDLVYWIECTGAEFKINNEGLDCYKIYASLTRPYWDNLTMKLFTNFMTEANNEEFFEDHDRDEYPYLLDDYEVGRILNFFSEAEEYIKGNRTEEQPELFEEEEDKE